MLGNFACLLSYEYFFFKITFQNKKKIFQEYHKSVEEFWSRSGPIFCRAWSGSKLFAKVIRRLKVATVLKELISVYQFPSYQKCPICKMYILFSLEDAFISLNFTSIHSCAVNEICTTNADILIHNMAIFLNRWQNKVEPIYTWIFSMNSSIDFGRVHCIFKGVLYRNLHNCFYFTNFPVILWYGKQCIELGALMRTDFLCILVLRVASGPRVKLAGRNSTVVYSTGRSKAVVPVLVLRFVALWFIQRGDLF